MTAAEGFVPGFGAGTGAVLESGDEPPGADRPRALIARQSPGDKVFRGVLRGAGIAVLLITGLIAVFLVVRGSSALRRAGWDFFTAKTWNPAAADHFGIATLLPNGIFIAVIALVIAVPVAIGTAIFISEYAPAQLKGGMIALVDLMAAVPSIVYALVGLQLLAPQIILPIRWVSEHLSFLPFFDVRGEHDNDAFGTSTFIAGVVVSLMVIPIIASISREVFSQAPAGEREAAYALGASRWGMVKTVVLPYGRGGMIGAIMLGFGRAMGETIAVALIINLNFSLDWRVLENVGSSIPALIALRYSESTPENLSALMAAGLVLFVVTLVVNSLASIVVSRSRSGAQTE